MHLEDHKKYIEELINGSKVFVFMKGEKGAPVCRFSFQVVHILEQLHTDYEAFNVLSDDAMRQAIKDYTGWPTIPQVFIDGKFIGGADIMQELYDNGELKKMLGVKEVA